MIGPTLSASIAKLHESPHHHTRNMYTVPHATASFRVLLELAPMFVWSALYLVCLPQSFICPSVWFASLLVACAGLFVLHLACLTSCKRSASEFALVARIFVRIQTTRRSPASHHHHHVRWDRRSHAIGAYRTVHTVQSPRTVSSVSRQKGYRPHSGRQFDTRRPAAVPEVRL